MRCWQREVDGQKGMTAPKTTVWELEPHTRAKHAILRRYLQAWTPILSLGGFPQIAYIDRAVSTSVRQPVSEFTEAPPRARSGKGPGRREAVAVCL